MSEDDLRFVLYGLLFTGSLVLAIAGVLMFLDRRRLRKESEGFFEERWK